VQHEALVALLTDALSAPTREGTAAPRR
jgi:hypothetical protein